MDDNKTWLIRTRGKQILGPTTKVKVVELLEKGSLNPDDEIVSGNGYWFWVKETELVDKYLLGDIPQDFNPVCEALDVLTVKSDAEKTASFNRILLKSLGVKEPGPDLSLLSVHASPEEFNDEKEVEYKQNLPSEDDLAYPELIKGSKMGKVSNEKLVMSTTLSSKNSKATGKLNNSSSNKPIIVNQVTSEPGVEGKAPNEQDLEYPSINNNENNNKNESFDEISLNEIEDNQNLKRLRKAGPKTNNGKYLIILAVLIGILIMGVFYYYRKILNQPLPIVGFINNVQAQSIQSVDKKKSFLSSKA